MAKIETNRKNRKKKQNKNIRTFEQHKYKKYVHIKNENKTIITRNLLIIYI